MIFNRVKALKLGLMDQSTKENMKKVKSMDSAFTPGTMAPSTKATGGMASCMV